MLQPSVSAGGPLLDARAHTLMMLPSPVTSTPFSVKDILKMEQQLALHPHAQHGLQLQQHFHTPPACALGDGDSPGFSDGEERMSYLNTLSEHESLVDSSLSPELYGAPALTHHAEEPKLEADGRETTSECSDFLSSRPCCVAESDEQAALARMPPPAPSSHTSQHKGWSLASTLNPTPKKGKYTNMSVTTSLN